MNGIFRNGVALTVLLIAATPVWAQAPATSPVPNTPAQTQAPAAPNAAAPEQAAPAKKESPAAAMQRPGRPQMSRSMARGHGYAMRHRWRARYGMHYHAYRARTWYPHYSHYGWHRHYGWRRWCTW